jgi:cytochrome c-type biogenesis protein CcmH/NrfG
VTLPAIACGGALLVLRRLEPGPRARRPETLVVAAMACAVIVVAVVTHGGNRALANASDAVDAENYGRAVDHARTARRWMPWSAEPWQLLGEAQGGLGRDREARESLREAVARDPGVWSAWLSLSGIPPSSEDARRRAKALNPLGEGVSGP